MDKQAYLIFAKRHDFAGTRLGAEGEIAGRPCLPRG